MSLLAHPETAGRQGQRARGKAGVRSKAHGAPETGDNTGMAGLTAAQRAIAETIRLRWERAHELARADPRHDPSDLYHALRCLELTPAERLRAGLQRGRLRTYAR